MFDTRDLRRRCTALEKPLFWYYASKALGCAYTLIERPYVDGIIYLTCFGCGIDSFVGYMVEHRVRRHTLIPFTTITLDEHSGEAGLNTRIEAFMDTIRWRIRDDRDIPAHG
jgi:predicted nucleotide-binding protein (sugar kinase/HSP70/actin superfamily)